jgi:hypothetical protein
MILIITNNITPKEEVRGFPKTSKKVPKMTSVIITAQAINVIKYVFLVIILVVTINGNLHPPFHIYIYLVLTFSKVLITRLLFPSLGNSFLVKKKLLRMLLSFSLDIVYDNGYV